MLVVISIASMAGVVSAGDEAIDLPALVRRSRPCVVLIETRDARGDAVAQATGFFVSADGRIVTNDHVLGGAASMTARTSDGTTLPILGVLADDPSNDLVLLKVTDAWSAKVLSLGDSVAVEIGQRIAIVGNPLGLEGTVSDGIISGIRADGEVKGALQLTAAISPGSSGSPVIDREGRVVGIVAWTLRQGQALNFAIPSAAAVRLIASAAVSPRPLSDSSAGGTEAEEDAKFYASPQWKTVQAAWGKGSDWIAATKLLVAAFPKVSYGHEVHGEALAALRLYDEAVVELMRAIELCPR